MVVGRILRPLVAAPLPGSPAGMSWGVVVAGVSVGKVAVGVLADRVAGEPGGAGCHGGLAPPPSPSPPSPPMRVSAPSSSVREEEKDVK